MICLVIQAQLIPADVEGYITTISSDSFSDSLPQMTIQIPAELVQLFANSSGRDDGGIRAVSSLYYNVESLFPSGRPGVNE